MLSLSLSLASLWRRRLPLRRVVGGVTYERLRSRTGGFLTSGNGRALYGRIS